jgi:signal peptide peptidase SppA
MKPEKKSVDAKIEAAIAHMKMTKCEAHHFGPWAVDAQWLKNEVDAIARGLVRAAGETDDASEDGDPRTRYQVVNGVAVVSLSGGMMKARSKFGGTSTVDVRTQIRKAVVDDGVYSILLLIDSPGGTVAGTSALAEDVANANRRKPVYAYVEDCCASAAYWVASQATRIYAGSASLIGSLGAKMLIVDSSKAAEADGLKVHDISTGEFKGAGADGTPITDRQIAYFQDIVNSANEHFKSAVMSGRNMARATADALFDGKVHDAAQAKQLGLIDEVSTVDQAMAAISSEVSRMNREAFNAYAAEHPEAVAGFIEQGKKTGTADAHSTEVARMTAIAAAFGAGDHPAVLSFVAGHDAHTAKLIADAAAKAKADAKAEADAAAKIQSDALAAKDKEIARLTVVAGSQSAVGTSGAATSVAKQAEHAECPERPATRDASELDKWAKSAAGWEWDNQSEPKQRYSTKDRFVAIRARELLGQHKVLTK